MEQLAQVRIAAWQGGSLWLLNTAPPDAARPPRTGVHAHHAVQVVISLGGRFRLWLADQELAGPFAAVAPDAPHQFDAEGAYAILFVEPESPAGRAIIAATFSGGDLRPLPASTFSPLAGELAALARTPAPGEAELTEIGRALVQALAGDRPPAAVDARVRKVIAWVAQAHDDPIDLGAAARLANLSPSRLSHLFVEQTGLSFKTYLLWIRLTRAVRLMTEGLSLTAAAHGAGFSDSAHFSRTFRRMFGLAPANLTLV
ncbi:helix-turn-helix transcriptional regulator [Phenylobacterium aquaticum]|uniref:helix-turn-helix transcriptional regulator n=1 Tax=Phenylobacterium aquaticum TaxID=1763816 RepID=UPI001F5C39A2|nr:AraC family transcriptional regulator [Phenylobacterium aquaticum]MCI3135225.1 AraC family transcriptional regulator [Phenylobacterium aquaticum]